MLNTPLSTLREMLKAEIGASLIGGVNQANDQLFAQLLTNKQHFFAMEYMWPHLRTTADISLVAGTRYYDWPAALDQQKQWTTKNKFGGLWNDVAYGVDEEQLNVFDSDDGQTADPVSRVEYYNNAGTIQLEVWPVPATAQTLRLTGYKQVSTMKDDTDTADLDDLMLVLFVAAELLTKMKSPDAQAKAAMAQRRFEKVRMAFNDTNQMFISGGGTMHGPREQKIRPTVGITRVES